MSLIISPSLVLTAYGLPAGTPLIGWHNVVTVGNLVADTAAAGYPAANMANPSTVQRWLGVGAAQQYVTVTPAIVGEIDYLAIARHNFASAAIAVSVEAFGVIDGSPATTGWFELTEPVMLPDDGPALFQFEKQSVQAIRLRLQAGTAAPTLAVLYVGALLIMERGIAIGSSPTPFPFGRNTTVISGRSEAGDFLGTIVTGSSVESSADFEHLRASWYRSTFQPFVDAAVDRPFFYVWHPIAYPNEVGFATLSSDPRPTVNPVTGRMNVSLKMQGILR